MREGVNFTVDVAQRLDFYLAGEMDDVSRSKIKSWCGEGLVKVNGQPRKGSFRVASGDDVEVAVPQELPPEHIVAEPIPLDIVYEDEAIVVVNKAAGMVVHPGAGIDSGTLANALAWHFEKLAARAGGSRPGLVHRLDKGTSGLILVAKTDAAHASLTEQWHERTVTKVYQALVWGNPEPPEGEVESHIGRHPKYRQMMAADVPHGRFALSRYKVVKSYEEAARVNVHILTGRTHQIRVHLAMLGYPVVGDALYGKGRHKNLNKTFTEMPRYPMLHAGLLRFGHPLTGEEMTFKQGAPEDFEKCERALSRWPY